MNILNDFSLIILFRFGWFSSLIFECACRATDIYVELESLVQIPG